VIRAIFILLLFISLVLSGCTSIEVAKEVTKASKSIKASIDNVISKEEKEKEITQEKQEILKEKEKDDATIDKQNKLSNINFVGETLQDIKKRLGEPSLLREDGKIKTVRFDTKKCKIFIYFDQSITNQRSEYYELRNNKGELVEKQKEIEECLSEIKLV